MSISAEEKLFGRLNIISKLGSGSQGTVYLAEDPELERKVAIKLLTTADPDLASTDSDGKPLEGRISGKLKHPNIVSVYDAGQSSLGPYLVFEFVQGEPLVDLLKSRDPFSIRDAAALIAPILDALASAHKLQIVHLDLSPRNIMIDADGVPRVMDFGLSQYVNQMSRNREIVTGTLRYMAPEHFSGENYGPQTDVFALGSTFLELVTGRRTMDGTSVAEIRQRIVDSEVDFSGLDDNAEGAAYEKFLRGALTSSVADRYCDCGAMQEAFRTFVREAELEDAINDDAAQHSTVEYLLRRMRKKKDFPTISRTLADINRLTSEESVATADKLANVILRDFALTSKLLKLVNSSFYGTRSTEVTSISQAVVLLGLEQVRMSANSLTFFGQMKGDVNDTLLKDFMTRSFLSGLLARHLAQRIKLPGAEEAFICGMFQSIGEVLVIYYFREEYDEICDLIQTGNMDKHAASKNVLGVNYATLGSAIATTWQLPDTLLASIGGVPDGELPAPASDEEQLRDLAVFANELCELASLADSGEKEQALNALLQRFQSSVALDTTFCVKLLNAAMDKLEQYAPLFEINVANSGFCRAVQAWIDLFRAQQGEEISSTERQSA